MSAKKRSNKFSSAEMAHLNELLDEALEGTFPASDPIAVSFEIESSERVIPRPEEHHNPRLGYRV